MSDASFGEVFCVGLAIQDIILSVDAIPSSPVKIYARGRKEIGGGPAATASVAIARLGGRAHFAGRTGADAVGRALKEELEAEGVGTAWLKEFDGYLSPSSVILVDRNGERLIVAYSDPDLPKDPTWLTPPDWGGAVLCDLSWPQGALKCLRAARERGLPAVLDADISRHGKDEVAELVAAADHVVFSRPGLAQFAGTDDIADGLNLACRSSHVLVGVTDGAHGLYWREARGNVRNKRPPPVHVVDTVGAGDAFHGALALALARRWPIDRAIDFCNAVAALKCSVPGGRAGLPNAEALEQFDPSFKV
ncbi:PfkB family carbohydrate kinase [Microvirga brassicacearum]|uniref:PfkB family carbohydrate kinase n=1 Tax=Microvirga brassicacearum TaxID=2580413 RepID=UPI001390CFF5|nr:PfkB family carbohydrate kinase [Microvirga brassicacearum]